MKINIIGGGPAGLYFGLLVKKLDQAADVAVFERNPPDATYGFGVVLADQGLQHLKAADAQSYAQIVAAMEMLDDQLLHVPGGTVLIDSLVQAGSISRLKLLAILQRCCADEGVNLHFDHNVDGSDRWLDADLVVAADGVNSLLRTRFADKFETSVGYLSNRFAWYGVARRYDRPALAFRSYNGGAFVGHYYRYQPEMSTFVAECDEATWFGLGLDGMTDDERQALAEDVFAEDLGGSRLIANHSIWRQFPVIQNEKWSFRNIVLLGDAQRSVHFSIGSGTRLAMEDAVALYHAYAEAGGDVAAMLAKFEDIRRPAVGVLSEAARRSYSWYEGFAAKLKLSPIEFAYDYMTRTGRMTDKRLYARHPKFMAAFEAQRSRSTADADQTCDGAEQ